MDKKQIAEKWWKTAEQNDCSRYEQAYPNQNFNIREPVLEIGGGNGSFLDFLKVEEATIIDVAGEDSLKNKNYKFIGADITKKLPEMKEKFKTIFVMETLEHIKNPLYLMAQVYDLLDDDGLCYIAVPYTKLDEDRKGQENPYNCHVARWTSKELTDQMNKLGFLVKPLRKRRRFKNTAFFLPHCWLCFALKKRLEH